MKVAAVEVFRSVQGEGFNAGRPAIFVRLSGCNLSCVFADGAVCDTPYQQTNIKTDVDGLFGAYVAPLLWEVRPPQEQGIEMPPPVAERVLGVRRDARPMLILTGGEPTLAPAFDEIVRVAMRCGFYVAVETNGTRWREGLRLVDWICVSPKDTVQQGSTAPFHNHNPQDPALNATLLHYLALNQRTAGSEFRYVIGPEDPTPPFYDAFRHYVSPAALSTGDGMEWQRGFDGFVAGAVQRCHEIVWADPRWRISIQTHKFMGVR